MKTSARILSFSLSLAVVGACDSEGPEPAAHADVGAHDVDASEDEWVDPYAGFTPDAHDHDAHPHDATPPTCWTDLENGEVEVVAEGFEGGTEGVAFGNDGRLYVSGGDTIWAIDADGEISEHATVPNALGLTRVDDGLIVASMGESAAPDVLDGAVYLVTDSGEADVIVDGIANPNFVVLTPAADILVSDALDSRVWRVTREGELSEAVSDIPSPNGMGYTPEHAGLIVASTFSARGEVTAIPVGHTGLPLPGAPWREVASLGAGQLLDGLVVGVTGDIFVLANLPGDLVRLPIDGSDPEVVATGLDTPASAAFGDGEGFDPCSLYITELSGTRVVRVAVGQSGVVRHDHVH